MTNIQCKELVTTTRVSDTHNRDQYFFLQDLDEKQSETSGKPLTASNGNTKGKVSPELAQNTLSQGPNEISLLNSVNQIEILPQYQVLMDKLKEEVI